MHITTVSVTRFFNQNTAFNDFKEGFVNRIREKQTNKKKDSQKDNNIFWVGPVLGGWVGARKTNIFLRSA